MHSRLEIYASRLAEVELSRTRSNSTPDSDDEHQLIAHYCQSLNGGDGVNVPRSPVQVRFVETSFESTIVTLKKNSLTSVSRFLR